MQKMEGRPKKPDPVSIPGASKAYRERIKRVMKQNQGSHIADLHNNGRLGLHRTIAQVHAAYTETIFRELLAHPSSAVQEAAAHIRRGGEGGVAQILSDPLDDDAESRHPSLPIPPTPPPARPSPAAVATASEDSAHPVRSEIQTKRSSISRRPPSHPVAPYACPFETRGEEEKVRRVEVQGKSAAELLAESERMLLMGIGGPPVRRRMRQGRRPRVVAGELGDIKPIRSLPSNRPGAACAPVTLPGIGGA